MSNRALGLRIVAAVLAISAVVSVFWVQHRSTTSSAEQRIGVVAKPTTDAAVSRSATNHLTDASSTEYSATPAAQIRTQQEGDVIGEWGEFVRFRKVATNCRTETNQVIYDDRTDVQTDWRCDAKTVADHPYADMTNTQLEQIAAHDGVAALILGTRLGERPLDVDEYKNSIRHLYSAVLLTGETQAYASLMTQQNIMLGINYSNNEFDSAANASAYVWAKAGLQLGLFNESEIARTRQGVVNDEELDIEQLELLAATLAQQFNDERQALIGETFE